VELPHRLRFYGGCGILRSNSTNSALNDIKWLRLVAGRFAELCGLQRPGDFVSTEDDARRHCFCADKLE
jgi:hypothetical protein